MSDDAVYLPQSDAVIVESEDTSFSGQRAPKPVYQCDHCSKSFSKPSSLLTHTRTHTGEKPFQCEECQKRFATKKNLVEHSRIHTGEKPFVCNLCGKTFRQSGALSVHVNSVHDGHEVDGRGGSYKCRQCEGYFPTRADLVEHKKTHEKVFVCDTCDQTFTRLHQAKIHQRIHTGEKPYCCEYCGKKFRRSNDLNCHIRVHTGDKPYQCQTCSETFTYKRQLNQHVCQSNRTDRPVTGQLSCQSCDFVTGDRSDLQTHVDRHTQLDQNQAVQCTTCHRIFTSKPALRIHERTHTGEKPYPCKFCDKFFRQSKHLTDHLKTHTFTPYSCECGVMLETFGTSKSHKCLKNSEVCYKCASCSSMFSDLQQAQNHHCEEDKEDMGGTHYVNENSEVGVDVQTSDPDGSIEIPVPVEELEQRLYVGGLENSVNATDLVEVQLVVRAENLIDSQTAVCENERPDVISSTSSDCPSNEAIEKTLLTANPADHVESINQVIESDESTENSGNEIESEAPRVLTETPVVADVEVRAAEVIDETTHGSFKLIEDEETVEADVGEEDEDIIKAKVTIEENVVTVHGENFTATVTKDDYHKLVEVTSQIQSDVDSVVVAASTGTPDNTTNNSPSKPHECPYCSKRFKIPSRLKYHTERVHLKLKPFKCSKCGQKFSRKIDCKNHVDEHNGVWNYTCDICCSSFSGRQVLARHMEKVHSDNPLNCQKCNLTFISKNDLDSHNSAKHRRSCVCEICGNTYSSLNYLKVHMKRHSEKTPFQCTVCQMICTSQESLNRHIQSHTKARPHQCPYCEKAFSKKTILVTHINSHTGEKPYRCKFCDKAFRQRAHRIEHERTHTGEAPYQCELCGFRTSYRASLTWHIGQKHGSGASDNGSSESVEVVENSDHVVFVCDEEIDIDDMIMDAGEKNYQDQSIST